MKCTKCGHGDTQVLETRKIQGGQVTRRHRACGQCGHTYNTYEVDEIIWKSVKKVALGHHHTNALIKRSNLHARNEQILAMLKSGEKHSVVASEFGLSDNMISTIARRAGVPSYARQRGLKAEAAKPKHKK